MTPLAFALLPLLGASPTSRIAALLVPMDQGAEAAVVRLETHMYDALSGRPGLQVISSEALFGQPVGESAKNSLERAERGHRESKEAFEAKVFDDAERKLRATLKEYTQAAPAMKQCGNLCDATAMYAATLLARGDVEEARLILLDLLALDPKFRMVPKRFGRAMVGLWAQVSASPPAQLRGTLSIKTRPAGAKVYLDGAFQGYSPLTIPALAGGKHHLRVTRPGYHVFGQLLETTPEDQRLSFELQATTRYQGYERLLDQLATEIARGQGQGAIQSLRQSLGVPRALLGLVKVFEDGGGTLLHVGYFELSSGQALSVRKVRFQGEEFGQLEAEVRRLVNHLLSGSAGDEAKRSTDTDPLKKVQGTEDWSGEDPGTPKRSPGGRDPLEGLSGTEDW